MIVFFSPAAFGAFLSTQGASKQVGVDLRSQTRDSSLHGGASCGDLPIQTAGLFFEGRAKSTSLAPCTGIWHCAWPFWAPRGHRKRLGPVEPARIGQRNNVDPGQGLAIVFFSPTAIGAFLSLRACQDKSVSVQGATHTISAFTEVIHVVIDLGRWLILFKAGEIHFVAPCTCVRHRALLFRSPRGHRRCSGAVELARRGQRGNVASGQGSSKAFFGPTTLRVFISRLVEPSRC